MADELQLIMKRIGNRNTADNFQLWACRGSGKGCNRNKYRSQKAPCDDCFGPLPPNWTLQQVKDKIEKGDA